MGKPPSSTANPVSVTLDPSLARAREATGIVVKRGATLPVKSSAAIVTNISAPEPQVIAFPELLLSVGARASVVPLAVYVPIPISQSLPSVMVYLSLFWSVTPAAANV